MDNYNKLAIIYDDFLKKDINYSDWLDYIEEIFEEYEVKVESILELAMGTGSFALELLKRGSDYIGQDISEEMLSIAQLKLREYNPKLFLGNMVDFKIDKSFDAIISNMDSINYIIDENDLSKLFKNTYENLNKDGIFIFDINSEYKLREILEENVFVDENDEAFLVWENFYESENIKEFFLNIFILEDGKYERFTESHFQRIYRIEELVEELKIVGFKDVSVFDFMTFDDVKDESERVVFVARK